MSSPIRQKWLVAASFALILPSASVAMAAVDITVLDAKITAGKLLVKGTTAPGTWVRLDGQIGSPFNVRSDTEGAFAFAIVYHPGDCVVDLQKLLSPTRLGAATPALVADCGPAGVSPRGPWTSAATYVTNDLVTYQGSTWRARRESSHATPAAGPLWELFAAGGIAASEETEPGDVQPLDAPTGPAGGDLTGAYPDPTIKVGAVTTDKIANLAVTTDKIALLSIGAGRLANGGVTSAKILDGTIAPADLAPNSVTSSHIASDAVGPTEIANAAIDSGEIADDSLFSQDLGPGAVGNSELKDNSVNNAKLANNSVNGSKVANNSLTTADIAGVSVNGPFNVPAGYVANGRCRQLDATVGGATPGEAVVLSINAALQDGIIMYAQHVPSAGHVSFSVCNFSGTTQAQISGLPVRIITFN